MQHAQVLGFLHILILLIVAWRCACRLTAGVAERLCATYVLLWANLVFTGLGLAAFSKLDHAGLYFWTSVGMAAALNAMLWRLRIVPRQGKAISPKTEAPHRDRLLRVGLGISLAAVALATAVICIHYVPNNADTCTYRISRAFFYLAKGNLLHAGNADVRLSYYPLNGALSYLFLAIYQFGPQWFNLVTALGWVFAGFGSYTLARRLGASGTGGLVAAWVCALSPAVLATAASGNDETLSAAPLAIGVSFACGWISTSQKRFAMLAGVGIGLGVGTKLHWIFYAALAALLMVLAFVRAVRSAAFRSRVRSSIPTALAAAALAAPLAGSFLVCNYLSTGQLTATSFNNQVLNKPFRLSLAAEKLITSNSELFLSAIPDLVPPVHTKTHLALYAGFNRIFMKHCRGWLREVTKPTIEGYVFSGPVPEPARHPDEYLVWLGFLPHLLLALCVMGLLTRRLSPAVLLCGGSLFFWHVIYAIETKYIAGAAVYYSFPAVIAAAALGPAWDWARTRKGTLARAAFAGFLLVFGTHTLLAGNLLVFGASRNIQVLWREVPEPFPAAPAVVDAIRGAQRIFIPYTRWELLYWNFMRLNPGARYTTGIGDPPQPPGVLTLLSLAPNLPSGQFPARLPSTIGSNLVLLGNAEGLPVFARGNRIEELHPEARYARVHVSWRGGPAGASSVNPESVDCCLDLEGPSEVQARLGFRSTATRQRLVSPWLPTGRSFTVPEAQPDARFDTLTIEMRDSRHPETTEVTTYRIGSGSYAVIPAEPIGDSRFEIEMPDIPKELADSMGERYDVRWLGSRTPFSVDNSGVSTQAVVELRLAILDKPHTAALRLGGRLLAPETTVSRVFWVNGAEAISWQVTLRPGRNQFVLESREAPSALPDGRRVSFLLIEDIKVSAP